MTNSERRQLLNRTKQVQAAGINVSIMDAFANPNVLIQAEQQLMQQTQQPTREVATTPEQQQQGLQGRPPEQIPDEYVMQGVPPGSSVHTNNVKVPLDIDYKDPNTGHLVESFKNVQPGTVLPGTPHGAPVDVVESRAKFRFGGIPRKKQVGGKKDQSEELTWANRPEDADMGWYEEYVNQFLGNPMGRADATATPGDLYDREKHALAAYYTARKIGPAGAMAAGTGHEATQFGDWRSFIGDTVNNLVGSSIGGATRFLPESWGEKAIKTISPYLPAGDSPKFPSHQRTTPYQTERAGGKYRGFSRY